MLQCSCGYRCGPQAGQVGSPVGQGALSPWPTAFVAHNRLRRDYLRTTSQLVAKTSSGVDASGSDRLAAALAPGRTLADEDDDLPFAPSSNSGMPVLLIAGSILERPNSGRQDCSCQVVSMLIADIFTHDADGRIYSRVLGAEVTVSKKLNKLFTPSTKEAFLT